MANNTQDTNYTNFEGQQMTESENSMPFEMRRLTFEETSQYVMRLRNWHSLSDVSAILHEVREKARFYAVSQGGLKFWREAFVGMSCAHLSHAKRFRLGADPPDFELDYGDHVRPFEIVDVMPADWQRGREYDEYATLWNEQQGIPISHVNYEQEKAEHETIPADVARQILAKKAKRYDPAPTLVMDIHHRVHGDLGRLVESAMIRHAKHALTDFSEIWLRKASSFLRVSQVGVSRVSVPWDETD